MLHGRRRRLRRLGRQQPGPCLSFRRCPRRHHQRLAYKRSLYRRFYRPVLSTTAGRWAITYASSFRNSTRLCGRDIRQRNGPTPRLGGGDAVLPRSAQPFGRERRCNGRTKKQCRTGQPSGNVVTSSVSPVAQVSIQPLSLRKEKVAKEAVTSKGNRGLSKLRYCPNNK